MPTAIFPGSLYAHRGLAADQHLTQDEWNQLGAEVEAVEKQWEFVMSGTGNPTSVTPSANLVVSGLMAPLSLLAARMPNSRWWASAYYWANCVSGGAMTVVLEYQRDDLTLVTLGSDVVPVTGTNLTKRAINPIDVTPQMIESVVCLRLKILSFSGTVGFGGLSTVILNGKRPV